MLDELATITPRQLWLNRLEEKGGAMIFGGAALSIDDVSEFMSKLKQSKYFTKVELKRTTAVKGAGRADRLVNFEITATAQYNPLAAEAAGASGTKG
jgi:type IV pilus assembly protein PilN